MVIGVSSAFQRELPCYETTARMAWRTFAFTGFALMFTVGCGGKTKGDGTLLGTPGAGAAFSAGGAQSSPSGGADSKGGVSSGHELPSTGKIVIHGSGGAASLDASIPVVTSSEAGAPLDVDSGVPSFGAGPPPKQGPPIRDTPPGGVVVLDPNRVYAVGYVSDVQDELYYGIAPVEDTTDAVLAIPVFSSLFIRPTDGHLLYTFEGTDQQGLGIGEPLYELRRDTGPLADFNAGEAVQQDGPALCLAEPPGQDGQPNTSGNYAVGFDGALYHSCGFYFESKNNATGYFPTWYSADQIPQPSDLFTTYSIAAGGRNIWCGHRRHLRRLRLRDGTRRPHHEHRDPPRRGRRSTVDVRDAATQGRLLDRVRTRRQLRAHLRRALPRLRSVR